MSDKNTDQAQNIRYDSKDIRRRDLAFTVKEKDSAKLASVLSNIKQRIINFPPFKGKNLFITLGVVVFVVAAAITLSLVLPKLLASSPAEEFAIEQQEGTKQEQQQQREDIADVVNNIDPDASPDTRDTILSDLDARISSSTTDDDRFYYIGAKAHALFTYQRYDESIQTFASISEELRSKKLWTPLANNYSTMSFIYQQKGDIPSALESMKSALAVVDEAASDEEEPTTIPGREYYQSRIDQLEEL